MIQLEEQGRRLRILVGGDEDYAFLIEPQDARTGATLLAGFLGILGDLFGEPGEAMEDLTRLSLGWRKPVDPDAPTEREQAAQERFQALWERFEELRQAEQYEVMQAAFFWQTQGGLAAAQHIAEGGPDGYPKALEVLAQASGLEVLATMISTGSSSESESGPTGNPATSTPAHSGSTFKRPQDRLPKQTKKGNVTG